MLTSTAVNRNAQMASYKVAYSIAQSCVKKPHKIDDKHILPVPQDMVSIMLDETRAVRLKAIPLSNDTVARHIHDISDDLEDELMEKLRDT